MATRMDTGRKPRPTDDYQKFYSRHADRYASNQVERVQRVWARSSHPLLEGNHSLIDALVELAPGPRGLDAGCGAGAIDVAELVRRGLDVTGIDAVEENVEAALRIRPFLKGRVRVGDLSRRLQFPADSFDFVMCNAVIQHLSERRVYRTTLPELSRITRPGGVLQLVFKSGHGTVTVHDPDYDEVRSFQLFDERKVVTVLQSLGMQLVPAQDEGSLGGLMYFINNNDLRHCALWARKVV